MGEPQKTLQFTPEEFKNAVAAETKKAVQDVLQALEAGRKTSGTSDDGGDASWVQKLAAELAQLNNQGPNAKLYVAPEVMAQRKQARNRMIDLIVEAKAQGVKPRYSLRNKVYLNERLIDPVWIGADKLPHRTEIEWTGVPSEAMIAVNEAAKEIYAEFIASIGTKTKFTDDRPQSLTAGGLVVHAAPPKRRETGAPQAGGVDNGPAYSDDLAINRRMGNEDAPMHILGTIAPPVRQTGIARGDR